MLRNVSIKFRASIGFAVLTALILITGVMGISRMSAVNDASTVIAENWLPSVKAVGQLNMLVAELQRLELLHVIAPGEVAMDRLEGQMKALLVELQQAKSTYTALISETEEKTVFAKFEADLAAYLLKHTALLTLSRQDAVDDQAIEQATAGLEQAHDLLAASLNRLTEINSQGADAANRQADEIFASASMALSISMLFSVALAVALAYLLINSITVPLRQAVGVAQQVAQGDLSQSIAQQGNDEAAALMQALSAMQEKLRSTLSEIIQASTELTDSAGQLQSVTTESSRVLHQQNQEIEMAATAVNEMTAAVEEVAHNASETSNASKASDVAAEAGSRRVQETIGAIREMSEVVSQTTHQVTSLSQQAQSIAKVLDVIRAIAEQTNLLALNAAIEAARAGEQGRGFAVVADEVRALAHRTQESTAEIEQMIGSIQAGTNSAVEAMNKNDQRAKETLQKAESAGQSIEEITEQVGHINDRTLVIASAAEEQAQVAREVDRNLMNIRDLSVKTSEGSRNTEAAMAKLSQLAGQLDRLVERFTV